MDIKDFKIPRFDEIKDRLGSLGAQPARPERNSHQAQDSQDDYGYGYEDFGEYAFDDNADYAQEGYGQQTEAYKPSMPKLVSIDDVRAHTQYTPSEDLPAQEAVHPQQNLQGLQADEQRSPGLNGLFVPSEAGAEAPSAQATGRMEPVMTKGTGAYDLSTQQPIPTGAAAGYSAVEPRVTQRSTRILTVIKPESYAEAERIAKILKAGDVAVLSLRNTPDTLSKRILDFSFGVACALDARVECVSGHVFAISRGAALTDGETNRLRDQGLI